MSAENNGTDFDESFQSDNVTSSTFSLLTTHEREYTQNYGNYSANNETVEPSIIEDYYSNNSSSSMDFSATATTTKHFSDNDTETVEELLRQEVSERQIIQFWIGVGLSISSSVFIGLSFIIKKKALIRLSKGGKRANQGGYGYLKDLLWWSGLLSMAVGEAANFVAYAFAPASLVSTLGVLSVLVTAILSSKYLNERLNFLGKIGCILCTVGSTVIVIHAPMEKDIESMEDLEMKLTNVVFVIYVLFTIIFSLILIYHYRPKLEETSTYTLLIWIGVCSMIGSLSVMSVKGLGLALMQTISGIENELGSWLTWFCFVTLVICVSVQMNFLNKALDTFNTAVVTPIYYVFFTSCVIIASAILFNEFANLPIKDWVGLVCGFLTVLSAIVLLHLCKNFDLTLFNLTRQIDMVNNSHSSGHIHHLHAQDELLKQGDSFSLPMPTTSCGIPVPEMDLKRNCSNIFSGKSIHQHQDTDSDLENDVYKSVDSCNSSRCNINKNKRRGGSTTPSSPLSPDSRLLSGSYNRDGNMPVSYGTTDNRV